jgi:DNA-binding transcriptional LysR family regulator
MSDPLDVSKLRYFVAVAEDLHFTRAAARLNIAQPALSQHIRRLEDELDVQLFERTRRSVKLTDAGRMLQRHAQALIEASAVARRDTERAAHGEIGTVVIGFAPSLGGSVLPAAYRAYRARFPGVAIHLREVSSPSMRAELLLQDQLQITLGPASADAQLRSERIGSEQFTSVALPAGHRLAARRSIDLREVLAERLITPAATNPYIAQLMATAEKAGVVPELVPTTELTTRLVLVAAGVGVTMLLSSSPRIAHPGIVYRPLTGAPTVDLYATMRFDQRSPHVMAFLAELRRCAATESQARGRVKRSARARSRPDAPGDGQRGRC